MAITMQKGEVREVGIEISSVTNEPFIIDTADYSVYDAQDKERATPLQNGGCTIQGKKVLMLYSATSKGTFVVEITYRILPEILKADVIVTVR